MPTSSCIPVLCAAFIAATSSLAAATSRGTDTERPSIFTDAPTLPTAPADPSSFFLGLKPVSPLSSQLRAHLAKSGLLDQPALAFNPAAAPVRTEAPSPVLADEKSEAIMMERFIVKAEKAPVVLRPAESGHPFRDGLRTGKLYHSVGKRVTTDISLFASNMGSVASSSSTSSGTGLNPTIPRIELAIRFSW